MLETERLVLRHLTLGDLDGLAALYRDPEVRRYFPEGTLTYEETREELEWCIDVYDGRYGYGLWATVRKDRDELIGRCGLLPWRATETPGGELVLEGADEHPVDGATYEIELAYLLGREHWGHGLAIEAARAIVDYALRSLQPARLICLFDPRNVASRRVAERVGFTFDRESSWTASGYPCTPYVPGVPPPGRPVGDSVALELTTGFEPLTRHSAALLEEDAWVKDIPAVGRSERSSSRPSIAGGECSGTLTYGSPERHRQEENGSRQAFRTR